VYETEGDDEKEKAQQRYLLTGQKAMKLKHEISSEDNKKLVIKHTCKCGQILEQAGQYPTEILRI